MTAEDRARARDILDLVEGRGPVPILSAVEAREHLASARRIAVVGASPDPYRPSNGVMATLLDNGYDCVPVNPNASSVLGRSCFPSLEDAVAATGAFDIVDVFRRAEHCPGVARSAVVTGSGLLWLQLGIVSWEAARIAADGGVAVVMDRCTAIELGRLRHAR